MTVAFLSLMLCGAVVFGGAALAGVVFAECYRGIRLCGAPPQSEPPVLWMAASCMLVGAYVTVHASLPAMLVLWFVLASLCAIWCTDARSGIIPDATTLIPLAVVLAFGATQHNWYSLASAAFIVVPFAIAASATKGMGMGWGDVKLAALGGAVLGVQLAIIMFCIACAAAAIPALVRRRGRIPIALGPYLVCAILAGVPLASISR
jgi:prepilin signal peptidase PulO-like enzyme (type II secretory pathway)